MSNSVGLKNWEHDLKEKNCCIPCLQCHSMLIHYKNIKWSLQSVTISGDYFPLINLICNTNFEIAVILDFVKVMEVLCGIMDFIFLDLRIKTTV